MAVVIDQVDAMVEAEQQPAPPAAPPEKGKPAGEMAMMRGTMARLAEREARLRAD